LRLIIQIVNGLPAIAVLLLKQSVDSHASSDAGNEIRLGRFQLKVYYHVALDYAHEADKEIRDPGAAFPSLCRFSI